MMSEEGHSGMINVGKRRGNGIFWGCDAVTRSSAGVLVEVHSGHALIDGETVFIGGDVVYVPPNPDPVFRIDHLLLDERGRPVLDSEIRPGDLHLADIVVAANPGRILEIRDRRQFITHGDGPIGMAGHGARSQPLTW